MITHGADYIFILPWIVALPNENLNIEIFKYHLTKHNLQFDVSKRRRITWAPLPGVPSLPFRVSRYGVTLDINRRTSHGIALVLRAKI